MEREERIRGVTTLHAKKKENEWCPMDDRKEHGRIANDHTPNLSFAMKTLEIFCFFSDFPDMFYET
jgi:hypothetical protein